MSDVVDKEKLEAEISRIAARERFSLPSYLKVGEKVRYLSYDGVWADGELVQVKPNEPFPYRVKEFNCWLQKEEVKKALA